MNKNDKRILELQEQVALKEQELKKDLVKPFVTNLKQDVMSDLPNNLNVMGTTQLLHLIGYIETIFAGVEKNDLDYDDLITGDGYSWNGLKEDAKVLVIKKKRKVKEESLRVLKSKLEGMLSEQAKTNKELGEVEALLKGM